ncbi:hypothetical protein A4D02_27855 [Niastella koreensis]|uniref:Uncharacterized protein n=1 Tax=Niastella koreensis TaxID=354356 RepID=A0ABX3NZ73_9BACT|nr:hypothetical protein A4D02_27855 [Niastella koreensis]
MDFVCASSFYPIKNQSLFTTFKKCRDIALSKIRKKKEAWVFDFLTIFYYTDQQQNHENTYRSAYAYSYNSAVHFCPR